jgi:hypothetical protein
MLPEALEAEQMGIPEAMGTGVASELLPKAFFFFNPKDGGFVQESR